MNLSSTLRPLRRGRALRAAAAVGWLGLASPAVLPCDLCAVYRASTAREVIDRGWVATLSEQYVPFNRAQFEGTQVTLARPERMESFTTHVVGGFNFSSRIGISLNLPVIHRSFERTDLIYSTVAPPAVVTERATETGLGDATLVGRYTVFRKRSEDAGVAIDVLGGIKFPTGPTDRVRAEADQARVFESLLPPGTPHDPLGHSISGVHQHEISPGSGSFDGVFGLTSRAYLGRWYLLAQFQYYLRTEGAEGLRMGKDLIVSGGPGGYVWQGEQGTLAVQLNAAFEESGMDEVLGRDSARTGGQSWFLGPQLNLTWGDHVVATAGVDIPVRIANHGYQNVPEYRLNAGVTWRF